MLTFGTTRVQLDIVGSFGARQIHEVTGNYEHDRGTTGVAERIDRPQEHGAAA
jgi:hypothetical protein